MYGVKKARALAWTSCQSHLTALAMPLLLTQNPLAVLQDLLGLLEGRETYVIAKDGEVKLIFNDQFGPEKCDFCPQSFGDISFH